MKGLLRWVVGFTLLTGLGLAIYGLCYSSLYFRGERLLKKYVISTDDIRPEVGSLASNDSNVFSTNLERMPRILHQTYESTDIPTHWLEAQLSCQALHQDNNWTYILWTDSSALSFLASQYPWFLPTYHSYPYNIQRVDALRYFILYHYGGFYLDLDVGCKMPLTPLLRFDAVFPKTQPVGVSNDVIGSIKGHRLFGQVTRALNGSNHYWGTNYPTVFFSTGPMFLTKQILLYLSLGDSATDDDEFDEMAIIQQRQQTITPMPTSRQLLPPTPKPRSPSAPALPEIRVLPPSLYSSNPTSFFDHYPGSSWHGRDVAVVLFLVRNEVGVLVLGLLVLSVWIWRRVHRARRRKM